MVKDAALLRKFERDYARKEKPNHRQALTIAAALREEFLSIGRQPGQDPLDGIEVKIRIAKALNHVPKAPGQNRDRARQA
jgi:hypothetical protein